MNARPSTTERSPETPAPPPAVHTPPPAVPAVTVVDPTAHLHDVLVYLTAGVVGLLGPRKDDPKTRFDSYQALFSALAALAVYGLLGLLGGVFVQTIQPLFVVAAVGGAGYVLWMVYQGRAVEVPGISAVARKQAAPEANAPAGDPDSH